MGGQVGEETRSAKFGADPSTGVSRGDIPIFELSFFFYIYTFFFFKQPTGQTAGRILTHDTSKDAKPRKVQTFGG